MMSCAPTHVADYQLSRGGEELSDVPRTCPHLDFLSFSYLGLARMISLTLVLDTLSLLFFKYTTYNAVICNLACVPSADNESSYCG